MAKTTNLDNWLREPSSITEKIAFDLPGRRTTTYPSVTKVGLGSLDNSKWPNWTREPDQRLKSMSFNLEYAV